MKGEATITPKKPEICGPGGVTSGGKTYSTSSGKGMRETYKETGNPGKGSK